MGKPSPRKPPLEVLQDDVPTIEGLAAENGLLKTELEACRREICRFCEIQGRWGPAVRKARKNGKLICWQHIFDGRPSTTALCEAAESREREFQRRKTIK